MVTETENTTSAADLIAAMPKAELHIHLDGCVRLETVADLAEYQGVALPVPRERLREVCIAPPGLANLMDLLAYYAIPLSVMQTPEALERITHELVRDLAAERVRYVEIRFG